MTQYGQSIRSKGSEVIILAIVWISVFLAVPAAAGTPFKHTQSRSIKETAPTAPGKTLSIESYSADLTITAGKSRVKVVERNWVDR